MDDATDRHRPAARHDRDTRASFPKLEAKIRPRTIATLVDGLTKLTNLQLSSIETNRRELRKLFMTTSRDLRRHDSVNLADRLHNNAERSSPEPRQAGARRPARPLGHLRAPRGRMGMQWMREELEDLAFTGPPNPPARESIMRRFLTLRRKPGDVVGDHATWSASSSKRASPPKSYVRGKEALLDLDARWQERSRVQPVVGHLRLPRHHREPRKDCYRARRRHPPRWRAVPGRFKDYISQPNSNGYRSIHTTVSGRDGKRVVGCRSAPFRCTRVAETGPSPRRWSYRDARAGGEPLRRRSPALDRDAQQPARRRARPRPIPRYGQAGDVHRPGVLLHPQGRR